jgi:glycosyltransferase involved in cell wall biosynthesis
MPVYNSERFLTESIQSVLGQTFRDWELIAVDDGSTDQSPAILQEFEQHRHVRVIRCQQNQGTAAARNAGVGSSDCEYLAFLDSDDLADPNRLKIQVEWLDRHRQFDVVSSRAHVLHNSVETAVPFDRVPPDQVPSTLLFRNCVIQSSVLLRRSRWKPYRSEFEPAEDYDLWARLAPGSGFSVLSNALVTYREHGRSISKRFPERMRKAVAAIYEFQLERLGVTPRVDLHSQLTAWRPDADKNQLEEVEGWLLELTAANRLYDIASFRRTIERIWFSVCLDSWALGPRAFQVYGRSRLARLTPARLWRFMRRFGRQALFPKRTGTRDLDSKGQVQLRK